MNLILFAKNNNPELKKKVLPLLTTYYSNITASNIVKQANFMLKTTANDHIKHVFKNYDVILSLKQPKNLLRELSNAAFTSSSDNFVEPGQFNCTDKRCKLCKLYIKPCKSFITSNNFEWVIRSSVSCNSVNVLYYLKCLPCNGRVTNTGKTIITRDRMNNHISECRSGNSSDLFDLHVHQCMKKHSYYHEPLFSVNFFMSLKHEYQLTTYEKYLHSMGYDTINAPK